ncbi:hypothetical protein LCGC14_3162280, partial [marine sediment metagenome]
KINRLELQVTQAFNIRIVLYLSDFAQVERVIDHSIFWICLSNAMNNYLKYSMLG